MTNQNIRIEVKGLKGRFVPFGKTMPNMLPIDGARYYLNEISRADFVALPAIRKGGRGMAANNGQVFVYMYTKNAVLSALDKLEAGTPTALRIVEGQVKLVNIALDKIRQTFGAPVTTYATNLHKWDDIEPDASCTNAPKARAWEKICADACDGKWVGALRGVQVDIIINPLDD